MTITIVGGGNPSGPTYPLQRSVRLRSSASAYFNRTPASAGNRKTWTWSGWVKRGALGANLSIMGAQAAATAGTQRFNMYFAASTDTLVFSDDIINTSTSLQFITTQVFRDPSAWYHIVLAMDTTQATSTNRVKLYINGVQVTAFSTATYPSLNFDTAINNNVAQYIGYYNNLGTTIFYYDGYHTEVNFIDGQALTPTSFGAYNAYGVWSPAKYTGTYGTNGFYLNFQDNSGATATTIGKDSSGNNNNWTPNNISVTAGATYDSMLDVPTLTSASNANFPVLNVIAGLGNGTYSDGNLGYLNGVGATWKSGVGSMGVTSGKYYFEYTITAVSNSSNFYLGVAGSTYTGFASYLGRTSDSWAFQWNGASSVKTNNDVSTTVSTAGSISVGNVIQVAIDLNTGSIWWGRNNTWVQGDPSAGTSASYTNLTGTILPGFAVYSNGGDKIAANFGQRPFTYTPPTGFKSLNTFNLPTPTIPNGAAQMAATLYTGTGAALSVANTVNGVSFQPDFVWIKSRSAASNHAVLDSVRPSGFALYPNLTAVEGDNSTLFTGITSTGFGVAGTNVTYNQAAATYVGWQWKANGTPAVTNTSGSIPSTISANTTSGFSIVTRTGTGANGTIGHGLGVAPKMIINKSRSNGAYNWSVYHASLTNANYVIYLDATNAQQSEPTAWNATAPTSTVFSVGTSSQTNLNAATYVSYCFSEIAGYSKFGSYTGNGSTNGPFVYLGFRPRYIMIKRTDSTGDWNLIDTSRSTYNQTNNVLWANLSDADSAGQGTDILSNGFKLRSTGLVTNASGGTYIYAAFAENPFNYSLAR
jgi:hypothetical protein